VLEKKIMNNKNVLIVLLLLVSIAAVRFIGIDKIPFLIVSIILILCMSLAVSSVLRYKGSNKGRNYLIAMTIVAVLLICTVITAVIIQNNFPQLSGQIKPIFISLMAILFIILLVLIFSNALYKINEVREFKER
jgi:asparagine N-glycosylation enzyme membrane subunit Stt3